jgi:hypothetical protein
MARKLDHSKLNKIIMGRRNGLPMTERPLADEAAKGFRETMRERHPSSAAERTGTSRDIVAKQSKESYERDQNKSRLISKRGQRR